MSRPGCGRAVLADMRARAEDARLTKGQRAEIERLAAAARAEIAALEPLLAEMAARIEGKAAAAEIVALADEHARRAAEVWARYHTARARVAGGR